MAAIRDYQVWRGFLHGCCLQSGYSKYALETLQMHNALYRLTWVVRWPICSCHPWHLDRMDSTPPESARFWARRSE